MNVYALAQDALILNYLQKNLLLRHPDYAGTAAAFPFLPPVLQSETPGAFFFLK